MTNFEQEYHIDVGLMLQLYSTENAISVTVTLYQNSVACPVRPTVSTLSTSFTFSYQNIKLSEYEYLNCISE